MRWHECWRSFLAVALLASAIVPPAPAAQGVGFSGGLQPLQLSGANPALLEANTTQGKIDQQRQINERLKHTLQMLGKSADRFRNTPYWDGRRDLCLSDSTSFDRVSGVVHWCDGTRCPTTSQNSPTGISTCDPTRRGPPTCNMSDWCVGGDTCELSRSPGVCIATSCAANMNRDDCMPRANRVRQGAWK
jgi:hypothetical protein